MALDTSPAVPPVSPSKVAAPAELAKAPQARTRVATSATRSAAVDLMLQLLGTCGRSREPSRAHGAAPLAERIGRGDGNGLLLRAARRRSAARSATAPS